MAKQVQLRRGTTAELSSVTGAEGELIVDTTKDTVTLHDGYTAGGIPLLREDTANLADHSVDINKLDLTGSSAGKAIIVNSAGTALEYGDGGQVLQAKTASANYNWGSVGHSNDYNASWLNNTLTAKADNSKFMILTNFPTDDTNSSSYGVGAGCLLYRVSDGANWWIKHAAQHDDYTSSAGDSYTVARDHFIWDSTVAQTNIPANLIVAGETYEFRPYFRFNNANAQYFNSNDGNSHNQWFSVMEIL